MLIEMISAFGGGMIGSGVATYILQSKKISVQQKPQIVVSQKQLKNDPRYQIAQDMIDQAQTLFADSAKWSSEGLTMTAKSIRKDAEQFMQRGQELLDEIKKDAQYHITEQTVSTPYPIEGYGVNEAA